MAINVNTSLYTWIFLAVFVDVDILWMSIYSDFDVAPQGVGVGGLVEIPASIATYPRAYTRTGYLYLYRVYGIHEVLFMYPIT